MTIPREGMVSSGGGDDVGGGRGTGDSSTFRTLLRGDPRRPRRGCQNLAHRIIFFLDNFDYEDGQVFVSWRIAEAWRLSLTWLLRLLFFCHIS